mmetsp:Transcript_48556/g.113692  ORF Transcript_48556/g.113692 Transcript_48556/m.113692 type:complete len:316 (+) Transcript_48556:64-1011(+)
MDRASGNVHHRGQALVAVKGDGTALKWIEECFDRDVVAVNGAALRWAALDRTNRDIVFKAVRRNWRALQFAAECCTSDPEIVKAAVSQDLRAIQWTSVPEVVLAAVAQHWQALHWAPASCRCDRQVVLAAVRQDGRALEYASGDCKADPEIVLAAVRQDGRALQFAAEFCRGDPEIVKEAVRQHPMSLEFASESCTSNPDIVMAAVERYAVTLQYAADVLLEDASFAPEIKRRFFILKICRGFTGDAHCILVGASEASLTTESIRRRCHKRFALQHSSVVEFVHGSSIVPEVAVRDWPGLLPLGEVTEYQLVVVA